MDTSDIPLADSGAPAGAEYDEVVVSVSDQHLSAGKVLVMRVKSTFGYKLRRFAHRLVGQVEPPEVIEVSNPLEDFPWDEVFSRFIDRVVAAYGGAGTIRLMLMGDCFDPLAVTWSGRFIDPPYEAVGAYKMRRIIRGHPGFFDALARFIGRSNAKLDIFVGNHDQFLCWPLVQKEILKRLAGRDQELASRVRFVDQSMDFEFHDRGVLYYHGMNAEPHNFIDPKTTILYKRMGVPGDLKRPILNKPLGSHMTVTLANRLKVHNPLVGRMRNEWHIWLHAFRHKWLWGLRAGVLLVWTFIYSWLFEFWDIRRKTGPLSVLNTVASTTTKKKDPVEAYADKLLERENVRVVVLGHSHGPLRKSGQKGTYINTGTWVNKLKFVYPTFTYTWKRFRRVEVVWRTVSHFLRTGELAFARQLSKLVGFAALIVAMLSFLLLVSPGRGSGYQLADLRWPIGILLVFFVLSGLFKIFAIKPDIVDDTQFTFGLVRHGRDGNLNADLMEYQPQEDAIREYV